MAELKHVDVENLDTFLNRDPLVIDVRNPIVPDELQRLLGGGTPVVSIPGSQLRGHAVLPTDKNKPILAVCLKGMSSIDAGKALLSLGFNDVSTFDGGIVQLRKGFTRTPAVQVQMIQP